MIYIESATTDRQHIDFKEYSTACAVATYVDLLEVGEDCEAAYVMNKWGIKLGGSAIRQMVCYVGKRLGKKFSVSLTGEYTKIIRIK